jgi:hypothetical protein
VYVASPAFLENVSIIVLNMRVAGCEGLNSDITWISNGECSSVGAEASGKWCEYLNSTCSVWMRVLCFAGSRGVTSFWRVCESMLSEKYKE